MSQCNWRRPLRRIWVIFDHDPVSAVPATLSDLWGLVHAHLEERRFEAGRAPAVEALRVAEESGDELDVAECETLLGFVCEGTGRYDEAERLYRSSLSRLREALGADHEETAATADALAGLLETVWRYDEAEPLYEEALRIRRGVFGEDHPTVATALNNLAGLYTRTGRLSEAETYYLRAAEVDREALGDHHPDYAIDLNNLSQLYRALGRYVEAEPLARQAAVVFEAALGEDHPTVATAWNNLGFMCWSMGRYAEAEPLYRRALSVQEAVLGDHPDVAVTLNNLGGLYSSLGQDGKAEGFYVRALELYERVFGKDHPTVATTLSNLAHLYGQTSRYGEAEGMFRRSLRLLGSTLGDDHPTYGTTLTNLAWVLDTVGRYDEAERLLVRAVAVLETTGGADHPTTVGARDGLAGLYEVTGRYTEAERLFVRGLEDRRRVLGDDHPDVASSQNNLAGLYVTTARFAEAERLYRLALDVRGRTLGEAHPAYAGTLNNLSALCREMGRIDEAVALQEQALVVRRDAVGERHLDHATDLNNLAGLYAELDRFDEAESLYRSALDVRREVLGEGHPDEAGVLNNLAALYRQSGRYAEAEPLYDEAVRRARGALGDGHPTVATYVNNLAELYTSMGRYDDAEPLLREVVTARRAALGDRHPAVARGLVNHALLLGATGRERGALSLLSEATSVDDAMIADVFGGSAEAHRMAYLVTLLATYATFLSVVLRVFSDDEGAVRAALDLVLRRKGIGAEALALQRDTALGSRREDLAPMLSALRSLRERIARDVTAAERDEDAGLADRIAAWEAERDTLEAELARQLPELRLDQRLRSATSTSVAAALPEGSALVEIVHLDVFDFAAVPSRGGEPWCPARYVAFVLHAGSYAAPIMVDLGDAAELDRLTETYLRHTGRHTDASGERLAAGMELRAALLDPLLPALGRARRLFVAPDGELVRLPFESLPVGSEYVIDRYVVSYLTSGRDALRFGQPWTRAPGPPLVVADPDFDWTGPLEDGPPPAPSVTGFARLSGTRTEGSAVAAWLGVRPLMGQDAVESTLKATRSPRVLHLATHGFFLDGSGGVGEAVTRHWGAEPLSALAGVESPLLRSGLALAGANAWAAGRVVPEAVGDGLLLAEDVTGLDLGATDLVVLSACETGLGEVRIGEGVYGLRRAFVVAGARALVMSLWRVSDETTAALMVDFYGRLARGEPRAEALRAAQLALRETYPNPYHWAAFVCQGEPGPLEVPRGVESARVPLPSSCGKK